MCGVCRAHRELAARPAERERVLVGGERYARDEHNVAAMLARRNLALQQATVHNLEQDEPCAVAEAVGRGEVAEQHERHAFL
jgi:hypothetical protein